MKCCEQCTQRQPSANPTHGGTAASHPFTPPPQIKMKKRKYTSAEILDLFKEQHRLSSPLDPEAEPSIEIKMEMSIRDWRCANDLLPWKKLYKFLNQEFRVDISEEEWKNALEPAREKKLSGVCQLIAKYAETEIVEPIRILGTDCLSAATFLHLKRKIEEKGVNVSALRPSSRLSPYLELHFSPMLEAITLTGLNPIEKITEKRKKKEFWNAINIFDPGGYELLTGDIVTFRGLIEKMIEKRNKNGA